jgi:hypothetical protein
MIEPPVCLWVCWPVNLGNIHAVLDWAVTVGIDARGRDGGNVRRIERLTNIYDRPSPFCDHFKTQAIVSKSTTCDGAMNLDLSDIAGIFRIFGDSEQRILDIGFQIGLD